MKRPAEWPPIWEQALAAEDTAEQLALLAKMEEIAYNDEAIRSYL